MGSSARRSPSVAATAAAELPAVAEASPSIAGDPKGAAGGDEQRGPTKHADSLEGGAWGCEKFAPPPSARGEDERWFNKYGEIVSWRNLYGSGGLYMCFILWAIPLDLLGFFYWGVSAQEVALGWLIWYAFASVALTMNHRFFSHAAFKTSRPWRFVLACTTLLGMQFGPIWWASKHRLHHKFCDGPKDPHSWKQSSFFYAWVGWFHGHKEQGIDVAYVHPSFMHDEPLFHLPSILIPLHSFGERGSKEYVEGGERRIRPANGTGKEKVIATELLLVGRLWWVPFVFVPLISIGWFGCDVRTIMTRFTMPMLHLQLPILLFNVMFHPLDQGCNASGCYALDSGLDPLTMLLGENCHEDHHLFPARAKRPGGVFGVDPSYWGVLRPMLALGLIWGEKEYKQKQGQKFVRDKSDEGEDVLETEAAAERYHMGVKES